MSEEPIRVFAPAKINLYLHVTGRRDDGYHTLDSLMGFVDIGDTVEITPSDRLSFSIDGDYVGAFNKGELDITPQSKNLCMQAAWALSKLTGHDLNIDIQLTKNLPLGAGIGGGSTDAAAVVWGLLELWGLPQDIDGLDELLLSLGADVPVCFGCETQRVQGIGEDFNAPPMMPELPMVLIYPSQSSSTKDVFKRFDAEYSVALPALPDIFDDVGEVCNFLKTTSNDLRSAAIAGAPVIQNALDTIEAQDKCLITRMSGSGSSCFGIFETIEDAEKAAKNLAQENPDWWVKACVFGRPERY